MAAADVDTLAREVAELMERRLRIRGADLTTKLRRGGRLLPRRVRRSAAYLAEASAQAQVPHLQPRLDAGRIAEAHRHCTHYLAPLGRKERRIALLREILTGVGIAVFACLLLALGLLYWSAPG